MERRGFLRDVLGGGLALGCSAAASPLLTPVAFASAPGGALGDNRLVVIILRGAMDGLDVVRPVGDRDWAGLRPTLSAQDGSAALDTGFWARHRGLATLDPLWQAGELAFVHAVSTPYRDRRSHFDGQDILEAGTVGIDGAGVQDGWLNRILQTVPGLQADTAYAIGREQMLILTGAAEVARWSPDARLNLTPHTRRLLEMVHHEDALFREASDDAIAIAEGLIGGDGGDDGTGLRGDHVRLARFAADRLRGATRIAAFSLGGWDTHARQAGYLATPLSRLSDVIVTLRAGLGADWAKTAVVCMTEFGRTARENGTRGTDHGTGGAMILAGGAIRGGQVVADWPGLADADLYAGRDLMPTRDVRAHAGWILRGLYGLDRAVIEDAVFPGCELGGDPGLLA